MRANKTILIVDDRPAGLYAAARLLQKAGYKVVEATNGEDAIRLAESASALLLDVNLPDIHGVEVSHRVKAAPATKDKPVVMMSAVYVDELYRDVAKQSGADGYLTVPLDEAELIATFDRLLLSR